MLKVQTWSGSTYLIDKKNKTWERVKTPELVNPLIPLRTLDGNYNHIGEIEVGKPINIFAAPIDPTKDFRMITTSQVLKVEEFNPIRHDLADSGG